MVDPFRQRITPTLEETVVCISSDGLVDPALGFLQRSLREQ